MWLRVCECVCVRPEGLNDHFKPPLSLFRPVHSILLDVWLFFGSIYWGDLLCRVQCLCETVSVYVQGRDDGHRNPGSLTVPCVRERVYLLWSLLLRSVYARCCAVSLGHHSFIFFIYLFFLWRVQMWTWRKLKTSSWRLYLFVPLRLSPSLVFAAEINEEGGGGGQNLLGSDDSLMKIHNTPVGCVFRFKMKKKMALCLEGSGVAACY